jgi:hypothetical protein
MVSHRRSTVSTAEDQLSLLTPLKRPTQAVDPAYLYGLENFRRAVRYSVSIANLEPKQVYDPLGMDKAIWSRIDNGGMSFPVDQIQPLRVLTGNDAPLMWLANHCGYELKARRSELEAKLEQKDRELAELRQQLEIITNFVKQTRSGG